MKTLFESGSLAQPSSAPLLMELGTEYCLLSKMDEETGQPLFARLWSFKETALEESLRQIGSKLKEEGAHFEKIRVSLAFPEQVILPQDGGFKGEQFLKALFPGQQGTLQVFANGKPVAFSIPHGVKAILEEQFDAVDFVPAQGLRPEADGEPASIHVFFVDHQIRMTVYRQHQLQLTQQYHFTAPLDVVYYLLKICTEFGLSQQETLLSVSGYIEPGSALYKELHQYFLNIRFSLLDSVSIDGQAVPKHYFTSLYNLAQCAL